MKAIGRSFLTVFALIVVGGLAQPAISEGDTYTVLKELELGPGVYEETINPFAFSRNSATAKLKGVSIAVQNGTENSRHRVASAQVFLNGEEIFDQNDFNHRYTSLSEIREFSENPSALDLKVRVNGSRKSVLLLKVTGIYEDDPTVPIPLKYYLDRDGDGVGGMIFRISVVPPPPPPPPAQWVLITGDINDRDPAVQ